MIEVDQHQRHRMIVARARQHAGQELVEAAPVGETRQLVVARLQVRALGAVALLAHLAQRALGVERDHERGGLLFRAIEHQARAQLVEALVRGQRLGPFAAGLVRLRLQAEQLVQVHVAAAAVGREPAALQRLQRQVRLVRMQMRARTVAGEEHQRVRRRVVHQRLRLVERRMRRGEVAQHDVRDGQVIERVADLHPLFLLAPGLQRGHHQLDGALGARAPRGLVDPFVVFLQRPAPERERQVGAQPQHDGLGLEAARRAQAFLEDLHGLGQPPDVVEHDAQRVGDAHLQDRILGGARQHDGLAGDLERARRHAAADRDHAQRVERERLPAHRAVDPEMRQRLVGHGLGFLELLEQRVRARQWRQRPHQPVAVALVAHPLDRGQQRGQCRRAALLRHLVQRAKVVVQQILL